MTLKNHKAFPSASLVFRPNKIEAARARNKAAIARAIAALLHTTIRDRFIEFVCSSHVVVVVASWEHTS